MKKINCILIVVAILGVIFAFSFFNQEGYAININSNNKEIIEESLNGKIKNIDDISKITLGQGFQSGKLTISHSFGKSETIYVDEGSGLGKIEQYIRENGYNLDNIGFIFIGISSLIIIYLLGYKCISKQQS